MERHGLSGHRLYSTWANMRDRCRNSKRAHYKYYGGRGITVCTRWDSFKLFLEDMLSTWMEGLTLDRIENNNGYYKSNCRWANHITQNKNRRKCIKACRK